MCGIRYGAHGNHDKEIFIERKIHHCAPYQNIQKLPHACARTSGCIRESKAFSYMWFHHLYFMYAIHSHAGAVRANLLVRQCLLHCCMGMLHFCGTTVHSIHPVFAGAMHASSHGMIGLSYDAEIW